MMTRGLVIAGWCVLLLVMGMLGGCAEHREITQEITRDITTLLNPAARLRARVAEYWDARVRRDLVATYQLHEPAFRRAVTLTAFAQGRGVTTVLEYTISGQEIQGDLAVVRMKVLSSFLHPKMIRPSTPRERAFDEQWVRVGDDWYRKFRFPVGDPYPPAVDWDAIAAERQAVRYTDRPAKPEQ